MAPHHLDLESLILQNCRAFLGNSEAEFDVLTRIDQSDQWYALVLKTEGGKRTKVLENKASRPERALEMLHETSARVVDQHVACHGYDLPPGATSKNSSGILGGSVKPEVIACGSSDSEAFASDSDDSVLPLRRSHRRSYRNGRGTDEATNARQDRVDANSGSESDEPSSHRTHPWGMPLPRPAGIPSHNPPPPPQAWGHSMPAPAPAPIPGIRPGPSMVPPPPGRNIPIPPMTGKSYPARLNITWPGNGKRNMLVNVSPTVHYLQQVAVTEANARPGGFANSSSAPYLCRSSNGNVSLRAIVRRVTLGEDDTYEITAVGNDLSALFRSTSSIPKFEIEIVNANIVPVFPPMPPHRPASAASSRSSVDIAD
ncbi:hypothetical protein FBEOM_9417 [Fusarium beomiforme]|uniref:Uncharacterized protein n=1 Tax=Fusarium beomiforme TaxID=44412 RepID=A0A9P5DTD0_9HYPO|nr:hypothetical protein FBEOM_9417 [Fusarium beomiforme]